MPRQSDTPASWTPTAGAGGLRRPDSDCRNLCGHRVSLRRPAQVAAERLQQFCQEGGDVADHASDELSRVWFQRMKSIFQEINEKGECVQPAEDMCSFWILGWSGFCSVVLLEPPLT